mgnify:CR=1 FL=1
MKVKLVCGFLGSGKTTFIRNYLDKSNQKVIVLINDFGSVGIDAELISQRGGLNVVELPSGCICCTLRVDLDIALSQIYTEFRPERLIIEPSGIATQSGIIEVLQTHQFSKFFEIEPVIGIIDATSFLECYETEIFSKLYIDQILNSDIILINKCDLVSKETPKLIEEKIKEANPSAIICLTEYCKIYLPRLERLDKKIAHLHFNAEFDSFSMQSEKNFDEEEVKNLFCEFSSGIYGEIFRAKGIFKTKSGFINLDYVFKNVEFKKLDNAKNSKLLIIGKDLNKTSIQKKISKL